MAEDPTAKYWDESVAYEYVEAVVWPHGPVCPHCGHSGHISLLRGESTRQNTYKCYACCKPFTVKVGTILEGSKIPLHKWLQAIVLANTGAKKLNPSRVGEALGLTHKTASFVLSRIRAARSDGFIRLTRAGKTGARRNLRSR